MYHNRRRRPDGLSMERLQADRQPSRVDQGQRADDDRQVDVRHRWRHSASQALIGVDQRAAEAVRRALHAMIVAELDDCGRALHEKPDSRT